jgi:serine/threonine-protein kinase
VPAATLVAGAVIGVGTFQFLGGPDGAATSASQLAVGEGTTATDSGTVLVLAADYVGRPFREVEAELAGFGLRVVLRTTDAGDTQPGLVTAVDPLGTLHRGDSVTVTYAVAPASAPTTEGPVSQVALIPAGAVTGTSVAATPQPRPGGGPGPSGGGGGKPPSGHGDGHGDGPGGGHGHGHHHKGDR